MFGGLLKEIRGSLGDSGPVAITVTKPFCAPARNIITAAFQPYGVKILHLRGWVEERKIMGMDLPIADMATVTVNAKAAAWAEYLLLRTGKLRIYGNYIDPRNAAWAARHAGMMPPAWERGKPWIESSCSTGIKAWQFAAKKKGKSK